MVLSVLALGGCMTVSDLGEGARYQMSDAGLLDHSNTRRSNSLRIQPDSFIYIAQGHLHPWATLMCDPMWWPKKPIMALSNTSLWCAAPKAPLGLDQAMTEARGFGAHYLLYTRFARADDRIGNSDEMAGSGRNQPFGN